MGEENKRRKKETTAAKYNGLPYLAAIISSTFLKTLPIQ